MRKIAWLLALAAPIAACAMPEAGAPAATGAATAGQLASPTQTQPTGRSFSVFFEEWSAALDEPARKGLSEAAALAKQRPAVPILIIGFADPTGSAEANQLLSRLRAVMVSDQLKADGVAANRIRIEWRGATAPAFSNIESRRVSVTVDPRPAGG